MKQKSYLDLPVPTSTASEDYIDVINTIMEDIGGVRNLMIFADNIKISKSSILRTNGTKSFINVNVNSAQSAKLKYENDNSSLNPYDYSFDFLLNNSNIKK